MSIDLTDESLMLAVKRGDVDKLGMLYRRYHARLFSLFCHLNGNSASSEDLVQEVFFRILKYRGTYREDSRFLQWIYQIARNVRFQGFNKTGSPPGSERIDVVTPVASLEFLPNRM